MGSPGCLFLEDRGRDFLDCFKGSVSAGLGANVHAQAGPVSLGLGYWEGQSAGLLGGVGPATWEEKYYACPLPLSVLGAYVLRESDWVYDDLVTIFLGPVVTLHNRIVWPPGTERPLVTVKSGFHLITVHTHYRNRWGDKLTGRQFDSRWTDWFWLEVSARLFIGAKVGFNPAEFLDFLLGWIGLDIADDDQRTYRAWGKPIDTWRRRLRSGDAGERKKAVERIAEIARKRRRYLADVLNALDHEDEWVAHEAAEQLGNLALDLERTVPALVKALKDRRYVVRCAAAEALGVIGPKARTAVPALREALKDRERWAAVLAAVALEMMGFRTRETALTVLEDLEHGWKVWTETEDASGRGWAPVEAIPALVNALADEDWSIRRRAAVMLDKVPTRAAPAVLGLVRALEDAIRKGGAVDLKITLMETLDNIAVGSEAWVPVLRGLEDDPNPYVRETAKRVADRFDVR
jgi:HEAT repeat protein